MASNEAYTQEEIDEALVTLIGFAGNASAAVKDLAARGKRAPQYSTLRHWADSVHWERYEHFREQYAGKVEAKLTNDMLDATRRATYGATYATEKAIERLEAGKDDDPARTAANLARVAQSTTDKRLSLQGRPQTITETRDAEAILRSLVQMGVIQAPEEPKQIEGTVSENGGS